ncbi:MAG: hypothetical protein V1735_06730 [Nanoarchaeota archaeon]
MNQQTAQPKQEALSLEEGARAFFQALPNWARPANVVLVCDDHDCERKIVLPWERYQQILENPITDPEETPGHTSPCVYQHFIFCDKSCRDRAYDW